jgi:(Z)-2-((N-methylformamido)methylene)-5-hydroxybutyrolactone dehydrogenase
VKDYSHYVDGEWVAPGGGEWVESENPYTGRPWARVARGTAADVDRAVEAACAAFEDGPWRTMSASARGAPLVRMADLLADNTDRLAELATRDSGRTISDMRGAIRYSAEFFRYYGGLADKVEGTVPPVEQPGYFTYTKHEPYGVVAAITPWNDPLLLVIMKLAPGLAAGNTFVVKPHEGATVCVLEFAALFAAAGFPPGVVNVVSGLGSEVGAALVEHPKVRKIAFTGGDLAARALYKAAAEDFKPVLLELGGKSPALIFDDADLDNAAKTTVGGMFTTSGQGCLVCSRVLVQDSIYDEFLAKLVEYTKSARLGDPADPETDLGPLANSAQFKRVTGYLDLAREEGATVATGGGPSAAGGYFVEPTILTDVTNSMRAVREEIFGPVMACLRFTDEQDAIAIANDTPFGLAAGIWTENMRRAIQVSGRLRAGTVWVNSYRALSFTTPFGGYRHSGIGRENGIEAIREYLQTKSVWFGLTETVAAPFGQAYG